MTETRARTVHRAWLSYARGTAKAKLGECFHPRLPTCTSFARRLVSFASDKIGGIAARTPKRKGGDTNLKICGVASIVLSVSRKDLPPSWNLRKALVEEPTTVAAHGPSNNVHV